MRHSSLVGRCLTFAFMVACAACTSGSANTTPPAETASAGTRQPVRVLRAAVNGELITPIQSNLRVAILWDVKGAGGDAQWRRAEDIGIAKTWPVHFTMDLAPKPPADAIHPLVLGVPDDPNAVVLQQARAKIVVYEDKNGNGQLDTIPEGQNEPIDTLRGADDDLYLEWVDGTDQNWDRNQYTPSLGLARGMNLVRRPQPGVGPECVAKPCDVNTMPVVLPSEAEVVLSSKVSAIAESLTCAKFVGIDSTAGDIGQECTTTPPPQGSGIMCLSWDRNAYLVAQMDAQLPTCNWRNNIHYCGVHRDASKPAPQNWPCP